MQARAASHQMAQMAQQKARSPHSNASPGIGDSGHCSGGNSANAPNVENPAFAALNNMFAHIGGNVHEFSVNLGVPQPMNERHPTNEASKFIDENHEHHSMVIEAKGNSVRLNVKKNQDQVSTLTRTTHRLCEKV